MSGLDEIRERGFLAQFHGPYRAEGTEVRQADFHPSFRRGYMLCSGLTSEPAAESVADALNDHAKMLAALEYVLGLCYASDDGSEHEHVAGCEGEDTCPACWAEDIRKTIRKALQ